MIICLIDSWTFYIYRKGQTVAKVNYSSWCTNTVSPGMSFRGTVTFPGSLPVDFDCEIPDADSNETGESRSARLSEFLQNKGILTKEKLDEAENFLLTKNDKEILRDEIKSEAEILFSIAGKMYGNEIDRGWIHIQLVEMRGRLLSVERRIDEKLESQTVLDLVRAKAR